eukprot:7311384-Alexandrium_andersonii.AAC.1
MRAPTSGIRSSRLSRSVGVPGTASESPASPGMALASALCWGPERHWDMRLAMAVVARRVAHAAAARAAAMRQ